MPTYESNIDELVKQFQLEAKKLDKPNEVIREIAATIYSNMSYRIHNDGKDIKNQSIGSYSTKDILIGSKSFVNKGAANKVFGSKKKRSELEWVTFKGRKLAVLKGGYKEIRNIEGKETKNVNLDRTGKLRKDLQFKASGKDYIIGFKSEYGDNMRKYQEEHFDKTIWGVTEEDKKLALQIFEDYINKILNA